MTSKTITILATEPCASGKTLFLADALYSFDHIMCPTKPPPTEIARYKLDSDSPFHRDIASMRRGDIQVILIDEDTRDPSERTGGVSYDGALLFFPCSYFVETLSYSLLRRALSFGYSSYYKELLPDIDKRVDYLVHCHSMLAKEGRIVKLIFMDDEEDINAPSNVQVMSKVKDKVRARVNIPPNWILLCDKMSTVEETALFRDFLKDLILRTATQRA